MPSNKIRIGIDLGGTKTEIVALSNDGNVLARYRNPTPRNDYLATLKNIVSLINQVEKELNETTTVGIATPGAIIEATGLLRNSNSVWLNDKPLLTDLQDMLNRPIKTANDANCFALSEAIDGAAANADIVFGVIVGTGTGAGIVINRQILTGANSISGEWGHNPMPWPDSEEIPGPTCYCGKQGCIETFLSGPGLEYDHLNACGEKFAADQIATRAEQGHIECEASLKRYEQRMARALASVINILDPDIIVLGGGLSNMKRLYENVPTLWQQWVFSDKVTTQLVAPRHGDSSGVRGAARLWADD
jgi:fructokinase